LYAGLLNQEPIEKIRKNYLNSIYKSLEELAYTLRIIQKILLYTIKDADNRKQKMLPSEHDKNFKLHLANSKISQQLLNNDLLNKKIKLYHIDTKIDLDLIKKLYLEFSKSEEYINYSSLETTTGEEDTDILLKLFKVVTKNLFFCESTDDIYPSWEDDESLVLGAVKKVIKQLKDDDEFFEQFLPDEEATLEFGEVLLLETIKNEDALKEVINPLLENWDMERVANIDLIMIKMAVTEFLKFDSIPTKVTLNEYVEISKIYSTEKSKEFINGLLDKLVRQFQLENKMHKSGRGLQN
ncbi:MAG TPA: transcription antitermination factor NusB, partial [Saprospiraceae bacterium]|nr:transcription antitermination factor NusB [Saprospiraceae bacterium]